MSSIDEIKARIDILDLVSETVQLRRSGKSYSGFCPFHPNTRTPAFAVFPESGTWHCFGQCNEGGDIFKFLMKKEGWDFGETLRYLAERAGIKLRPPTPQEEAEAEEHERLRSLLEDAVTYYRHQLTNTDAGRQALAYLHGRHLTDQTIETYGLGYAPKAWDAAVQHFTSKGYSVADLLAAGLVSERESGGVYDRFRQRVLFPIRDQRSRMAGFGARSLDPDDMPKYLNSPQTSVFDKSHLLFGLDRARKAIRTENQVVIVEGYLDVIALYQAGYRNVVSPMGTALTEHQLRQLKRLTRRIVLALDADAAGIRATLRGLQVARQALDREPDPVFDSRGLLRNEARLQADIRVTTLPEGMDPDEVVNQDPEEWKKILGTAQPIVMHVLEALAADRDLDDPKVKTEIATQILPLIHDLPNAIERDTYRQRLARRLRVDERSLLQLRPPRPQRRRPKRKAQAQTTPSYLQTDAGTATGGQTPSAILAASGQQQEAYCLGLLLRRPSLIYLIDRGLKEAGLERLSSQDFQGTDHQVILQLIQESLEQDQAEPEESVLANLPLDMMDLADELLGGTADLNPDENRVLEDLMRTILGMRRRNISQSIEQLRHLMEDAQEEGDLKARQYLATMSAHINTRGRLDRAIKRQIGRTILSG